MPQPQTSAGGMTSGNISGGLGSSINSNRPTIGSSTIPTSVPVPGSQTAALQNRFVVRVENTPKEFTEQSMAFAMNLAKKELLLLVEQSVTSPTREHVVVQDWVTNPKRKVVLEIHDGMNQPVDTITFKDVSITDHAVDFNYGSLGAVVHILILSYGDIDLGNSKAQAAYKSAMSIVGGKP